MKCHSVDLPTGRGFVLIERSYRFRVNAEPPFYHVSWLITAPQPDDLWRRAVKRRHIREIDILRNENKAVRLRVFPDGAIIRFSHPEQTYLV